MKFMHVYRWVPLVLAAVIVWTGCAGPKEVTDRDADTSVELADVETFDPAPYRIEVSDRAPFELVHQVPGELMQPADSSLGKYSKTLVIRSGYRVQIFSGEMKSQADQRLQEALNWWESQGSQKPSADSLFSGEFPIRVVYRAPYYKVRIGDFVERPEAQKALKIIRDRFPDAWIVPDQVEMYR